MNISCCKILLYSLLILFAGAGCRKTSVEEQVHHLLTYRMNTLAIAESCTGGVLSSRFTSLPGASAYFLCGMITYNNDSKRCLLNVSVDSISRYGVVSEAVVRQMAEGARSRIGADYAIATTGFAGPTGGTPEAPLGTVWIAVATPDRTVSKCIHVDKDRKGVIRAASDEAITMLLKVLREE